MSNWSGTENRTKDDGDKVSRWSPDGKKTRRNCFQKLQEWDGKKQETGTNILKMSNG